MNKGFVALVGAGPGDLGLLTIRGMEYIKKADVVVYDRLVSKDILNLIPENAVKLDVGKESSNHLVEQDKINEILLSEAMEGKTVVRLKGGDPFLFGRGGEELELLEKNGISFEVVPGISSAVSVPAYAGIPVTHRDFCSSVHIVTGHQKANEPLNIDFDALVKTGGTLVFLMGVSSLRQITDALIAAGMDKCVPAAVIENGTRPDQRKIVATLESLYENACKNKIKSPSIIVVGEVCSLSEKYDWFSKRPLFGKKIIVTRPKISGNSLSKKLKEIGAEVYDYPCIEINEIPVNERMEKALEHISEYSWLVFTSKNGVNIFFDYLKKKRKDFRFLKDVKIAAIGSQTSDTLAQYGIYADFMPEKYDGKSLSEGLCKIAMQHEKILLLRALKGSEEIIGVLKENHMEFDDIGIYDTVYTSTHRQEMKTLVENSRELTVTFTSASTVEGFVKSLDTVDLSKVTGICIGDQTAQVAQKYGIKHYISAEATIDSMILKIKELMCEHGNQTTKTEE